jgi:N-glycosylase/DNA lyase
MSADNDLRWAAVPARTLNFDASLSSGQTFRWRRTTDGEWRGVIGSVAVRLRPAEDGFRWQTLPEPGRWDLIRRYFALDVDLEQMYPVWEAAEPRIGPSLARHAGMRILRQEAEEAFFAFQCASCNTIPKISRSVTALARRYGEPLAEIEGETFYRFPSAERIAEASEADLRADLWGFRAPRLIELARHVAAQGEGWLESLRAKPYGEAHMALASLPGIGAKIADCICLCGLQHDEACPIDTHVRQMAVRMFRPDLAGRSLTPGVYAAIASLFREKFGPYAGWAQQYLFYDELRYSKNASL